jgi:hypothetical protein
MNTPNRAKLLADALIEANRKAQEELSHKKQVERLTADVQARLAAHKAVEDGKRTVQCPHCSESFDVSWKTSDVTSESGQDDEDNEGDGVDGAGQDDDDQDDDRELDAKAKSRVVAELLRNHKRRR